MSNDCLNNTSPSNPKINPGEEKVNIPYIICAAIWFNDMTKHEHQPKNISYGFVVAGRRHHNCYMTVVDINEVPLKRKAFLNNTQGFLTSDDRFVDRREAAKIAIDAGQVKKHISILFSEDLY